MLLERLCAPMCSCFNRTKKLKWDGIQRSHIIHIVSYTMRTHNIILFSKTQTQWPHSKRRKKTKTTKRTNWSNSILSNTHFDASHILFIRNWCIQTQAKWNWVNVETRDFHSIGHSANIFLFFPLSRSLFSDNNKNQSCVEPKIWLEESSDAKKWKWTINLEYDNLFEMKIIFFSEFAAENRYRNGINSKKFIFDRYCVWSDADLRFFHFIDRPCFETIIGGVVVAIGRCRRRTKHTSNPTRIHFADRDRAPRNVKMYTLWLCVHTRKWKK